MRALRKFSIQAAALATAVVFLPVATRTSNSTKRPRLRSGLAISSKRVSASRAPNRSPCAARMRPRRSASLAVITPFRARVVLDVTVVPRQHGECLRIVRVIASKIPQHACCLLDLRKRHVKLVQMDDGIDVAMAGTIARLERLDRPLVLPV